MFFFSEDKKSAEKLKESQRIMVPESQGFEVEVAPDDAECKISWSGIQFIQGVGNSNVNMCKCINS